MEVDVTDAHVETVARVDAASGLASSVLLELLAIIQERRRAGIVEAHLGNILLSILVAAQAKEDVLLLEIPLLVHPVVDLDVLWLSSLQRVLLSNHQAIVALVVDGQEGSVVAARVVLYLLKLYVSELAP